MEQRQEWGTLAEAAFWESALITRPDLKYDNRAYLVAAYAGWAEGMNRKISAIGEVAEQIVPDGYASGYRSALA